MKDKRRYRFFGENKTFVALLQLESGEMLGNLTVVVDPVLAAQGFMDHSVLVIASGLIRNILLSFILIFVFHHTITKKLVTISSRLADVDIKNPHEHRIPEGSFKKTGELRDLVHTVNRMLGIIASDIEERELREQALLMNETELAYQANHDTLTGLVNRRGFTRPVNAYTRRLLTPEQLENVGLADAGASQDGFVLMPELDRRTRNGFDLLWSKALKRKESMQQEAL